MVKFDFDTYSKNYIDEEIFSKNFNRKEEVFSKFNNSEMIGWTRKIDNSIIDEILRHPSRSKKLRDYLE